MSESMINWGEPVRESVQDIYSGVLPGEDYGYRIYYFPFRELYSLYWREYDSNYDDQERLIFNFKHLENAKVFAEYLEKNSDPMLDVITQSSLWKINVEANK